MGKAMKSYAKTFGLCGLVYSACECVIEKEAAIHNHWTILASGCAAGGVLGVSGGVAGMGLGCAGFAFFSLAIEHFLDL